MSVIGRRSLPRRLDSTSCGQKQHNVLYKAPHDVAKRETTMTAVLFGSIGTLADTSELQREAFNEAFREHGLDWNWSRDEYRELLRDSGGAKRIAAYAQERGDTVDA